MAPPSSDGRSTTARLVGGSDAPFSAKFRTAVPPPTTDTPETAPLLNPKADTARS